MVAPTLVETQIDDGEKIIRQLDDDEFPVGSALWYYYSDKEKWTLLISTPLVKTLGPKESYRKIKMSLDKLHGQIKTPSLDVGLIKPEHEILRVLKSAVRVGPGISRVRFTGNIINGVFIEDALIYRIR